ncbi:hypothetical protein TRVA0_053S00606 [Trichomonascus vanleenenianus]|uniref:uncharacterized protein n=1 Tax=Trichomonascus vanleenenianus TaxID=2268995 RepID=UPI003EC9E670
MSARASRYIVQFKENVTHQDVRTVQRLILHQGGGVLYAEPLTSGYNVLMGRETALKLRSHQLIDRITPFA